MKQKLHSLISVILIISVFSSFAITSNASANSQAVSIDNYSMSTTTGVEGFVTRLYSLVLGRTPDQVGFDDWCSKLYSFQMDGGNVARSFFYSQEYLNKNVPFEEYLITLYAVFFDRQPDQGGYDNWCNYVYTGGHSRHEVLDGFINSAEWSNVCASFGIISGSSTAPTITVNANERICSFVTALYSEVLGRAPDVTGFNDWTNRIATCQITGKQAAYGFFYSPEFMNLCSTLSDEEIVNIFYSVFLGRGADPTGMQNWLTQINNAGGFNTTSLNVLFNGFADSTEFKNICATYGIAHSIPSSEPISAPGVQTSESTPTPKPTRSDIMSVTIDLGNGETTTVTGYYDYGIAEELFENYNNERMSSYGLAPLRWNDSIAEHAELRAAEYSLYSSSSRPNDTNFSLGCHLVQTEVCSEGTSPLVDIGVFRESHNVMGIGVFVVETSPNLYHYYIVEDFGYEYVSSSRSEEMTVTIDLGNGETTTVTGYYDYGMAEELFDIVNEYRIENGVNPLTWDYTIRNYAELRAAETVILRRSDHMRPNGLPFYSGCELVNGENCCYGEASPQYIFDSFRTSPGHNENMLRSQFSRGGFAVFVTDDHRYGFFTVQSFGC